MFAFKVWKSSLQLLLLSVPESLATSLVPASTWRCGEQCKTQTRVLKIPSITALCRSLQFCVFYRDKDEEVSLSQKFEEIKSNFNSLRRWGSCWIVGRPTQQSWEDANVSPCCRIIKDAKKEKGTDDFLGKVVVKLQVIIYPTLILSNSAILPFH